MAEGNCAHEFLLYPAPGIIHCLKCGMEYEVIGELKTRILQACQEAIAQVIQEELRRQ